MTITPSSTPCLTQAVFLHTLFTRVAVRVLQLSPAAACVWVCDLSLSDLEHNCVHTSGHSFRRLEASHADGLTAREFWSGIMCTWPCRPCASTISQKAPAPAVTSEPLFLGKALFAQRNSTPNFDLKAGSVALRRANPLLLFARPVDML